MTNKLIVLLAGDRADLGFHEVRSLLKLHNINFKISRLDSNYVEVTTSCAVEDVVRALSHSSTVKSVIKELKRIRYTDSIEDIIKSLKSIRWNFLEGRKFKVEVIKVGSFPRLLSSPIMAGLIGSAIVKYTNRMVKVDLKEPDVVVIVLIWRRGISIGYLVSVFRRGRFRLRTPKVRPFFHPSSLTPDVSLLLVNLALGEARLKGTMLDPFCGSGSTLIEAALKGFYSVGVDINRDMCRGAIANLKFFQLYELADIVVGDACMLPFRSEAFCHIATDPPYGRVSSTSGRDLLSLLNGFWSEGLRVIRRGGVIAYMHPGWLRAKTRGDKVGEIHVHGDLVRVVKLVVKP